MELENRLTEKDRQLQRLQKTMEENQQQSQKQHDNNTSVKSIHEGNISTKVPPNPNSDWYTSMTFEQLASSSKPVNYGAATSNTDNTGQDDNNDELKEIAQEIRKLQTKKRKKKLVKNDSFKAFPEPVSGETLRDDSTYTSHSLNSETAGASLTLYERNGSAGSNHSVLLNEHIPQSNNTTDLTVTSRNDSQDSDIEEIAGHKTTMIEGVESIRSTPVDPSSIRQISALGIKSKSKSQNKKKNPTVEVVNRQLYSSKSQHSSNVILDKHHDLSEADLLINSIDEDLLKYNSTNVTPAITAVSS